MKQATASIVKSDEYLPHYFHSSVICIVDKMHFSFSVPYEDLPTDLNLPVHGFTLTFLFLYVTFVLDLYQFQFL